MLNYGVRQGSRGGEDLLGKKSCRRAGWCGKGSVLRPAQEGAGGGVPAGGVQPDKEKRPPQVRQAFLTW